MMFLWQDKNKTYPANALLFVWSEEERDALGKNGMQSVAKARHPWCIGLLAIFLLIQNAQKHMLLRKEFFYEK